MIKKTENFKDTANKLKIMQMFFDREVEYVNDVGSASESNTTWNYYRSDLAVIILMEHLGFKCPTYDLNHRQSYLK